MQARYLILIFTSYLLQNILCETHCAINENDKSRISFIGDSPFSLRQPHSLIDLIKQVEMVKEKASLKASITQQEMLIEKRYDDDDPDIEKRIHDTDENCLKSKSLDLQTERFIVTYPIDLVPYFVYDMRFNREMIASTRETLQLFALERIFGVNAKSIGARKVEPRCTDHALLDMKKDEEVDTFANVAEPELADLNAEELENLSFYLNDRLKQKSTRNLALYYAHFYWRIRGDTRNAIKCLLRYLADNSNAQAPVNFQLASLYIRIGKYDEAVNILQTVVDEIDECAECHAALGDAYVLVGNFMAAVVAFDQAIAKDLSRLATSETATVKAALLRCVLKVFEVMENQHSTLLDTIDDINEFKDKSTRVKLLNVLIEANRASPETRLQAKLAYEHYMAGPVPHLNCYGVTQRFFSVFGASSFGASSRTASVNIDEDGLERLHCVVDDLDAFNTSLLMRYRELLETAFKEKKIVLENENNKPTRAELFRAQLFKFLQESNTELVEYAKKLAPYMSMEIDTPSREPRYSQNRGEQQRLKIGSCLRKGNYNGDQRLLATDAFHLFLSPDHKGYIVSDILTKYLALNDGELLPLPWNLPTCHKFAAATRTNQTDDKNLTKLDSLNKLLDAPMKMFSVGDKHLKQLLLSLPIGDGGNLRRDDTARVLLGELGQRIVILLKYRVGADWISLNLAALYLRYFGLYKDAAICLRSALQLENSPHKDIAYTQMAQIFIQLAATSNTSDETRLNQLKDANVLLRLANQEDPNEPIPHFLLGVVAEMMLDSEPDSASEDNSSALKHYWEALTMEPNLDEARRAILHIKCAKQSTNAVDDTPIFLKRSFRNENPPLCCWPNEQEVYCFKRSTKSRPRSQSATLKNIGPEELCYTLEDRLEPDMTTTLVYFRCNVIYTGRSYRPPPYAQIITSFLRPAEKLRHRMRQRFVKLINDSDDNEENKSKRARSLDDTPVLALDYGGYSESRIRAHQAEFSRPSDAELHQSVIILTNETTPDNETNVDFDEDTEIDVDKKTNEAYVDEKLDEKSNIAKSKRLHLSSPHSLSVFATVIDVHDVLLYDILKPTNVPPPMPELVELGKQFFPLVEENLGDYCKAYKKAERILEQPASTYVSVTAKGLQIHKSFMATSNRASANEEPFCPEANQDASASYLMNELDALPAYQMRQQLKFYRPETALRDALQSLGEIPSTITTGSNRRMRIDETATRLAHAMRASQIYDGNVDWTLSGASSLYWRVKGDAINAIKCLRHSLNNSPDEMKDIALISIANIYQQAGFHHSALVVGGKALRVSPNSVVAIHFTLANIYVSIGDFSNALAFYYSSLALQSRFDGAKDRIRAIHCETGGKLLH